MQFSFILIRFLDQNDAKKLHETKNFKRCTKKTIKKEH